MPQSGCACVGASAASSPRNRIQGDGLRGGMAASFKRQQRRQHLVGQQGQRLVQLCIGETFDAIVTGAAAKGTFVRIQRPTVEGRVVRGFEGLDVADTLRVRLLAVDAEQGYIDFERA